MSEQLESLKTLINNHLSVKSLLKNDRKWKIDTSSIDGRGIIAVCDIKPNEIIFIDHPILIGPRATTNIKLHCVICYSNCSNLQSCHQNCGLPICINCINSTQHKTECGFIKERLLTNKHLNEISEDLFRSLTVLRSLFINQQSVKLINSLACHFDEKKHGFEIDLLKNHIHLTEDEIKFLKIVCSVLDSNAFETIVIKNEKQTSLRGLYPLSSILNHNCVPNITNLFDSNQNMIVKATVPIKSGTEIFTSYTSLLWATQSRQHHLASTKHFWCHCDRCKDPKEFGTNLGALKCIAPNCDGIIFIEQPLETLSKWKCTKCNCLVTNKKVGIVQSALGSLLRTVDVADPDQLIPLIRDRVENVVPANNQIAIELKLRVIWLLGHEKKFQWNNIKLEQLIFKEKICLDILKIIVLLGLGQCKLRGLILNELYRCKIEIKQRKILINDNKLNTDEDNEIADILKEIKIILENDITWNS